MRLDVLEEFAEAAQWAPRTDYDHWSVARLVRNARRMRELRADPYYREQERARQREARRAAKLAAMAPVIPFVSQRVSSRWTDPSNPWMADVILEVET